MAKNSWNDYSSTNASNSDIQSIDISEGCSPSNINNAIRELMVDTANVVSGSIALSSINIDGGAIDGTAIGANSASTGAFTTLSTSSNVSVTGNITVSGTVDGRDVATDGSKLDGIESGATADQSAAEILTLIKTVDGAGSGLDADQLDGLSSGSFLRSDAADTKTSGDLVFSDSVKAAFGASSDLQIYHNGSNSFIDETGTGGLYIRADNIIRLDKFTGETLAAFNADGSIDLYYDNSKKFETTTSGISITGNITVSGTVDGRDVASDGSKLDGIESGATADQSAAEILTAIKSVDGAGSGLDADTLDGSHASSFLTGNQTITLSGDVTGSGTTSISTNIAANVVGASELNVSGNGSTSQFLRSDGDGSFSWATPTDTNTDTTYSAGTALTLSGTTFSVTSGGIGATQLNVSGNGTTSQFLRSDGDGSFTWAEAGGGGEAAVEAWVNFYGGDNTLSVNDSGGVSSVTDNSTGLHTVNFTTAFSNTNYVLAGTCRDPNDNNTMNMTFGLGRSDSTKTTSACQIACAQQDGQLMDSPEVNALFFYG